MYGWEMLLGVWGVVRVCFAGPVAWFGTLHLAWWPFFPFGFLLGEGNFLAHSHNEIGLKF